MPIKLCYYLKLFQNKKKINKKLSTLCNYNFQTIMYCSKLLPDKYFELLFLQDTGLHYDHYLREVIDFLEKDEHFREKLRNTDMEDIKVACVVFFF